MGWWGENIKETEKALSECYAQCPNPPVGREKASKTMQLAKREVYW